MTQTLYKDGYDSHPSPGTLPEPIPDHGAPPTGCSVEVPYRQRELVVAKGETLTLEVPDQTFLETLFQDACEFLPSRLLGVVRPGIRDQYTLCLSHHELGSVELHWRAKRGRNVSGRGRRRFMVFGRECSISSSVSGVPSTTIHEQACTFRLPFPAGKRAEIPDFFVRDRNSFWAEIAWLTDRRGKPRSSSGARRYPIGYDTTSEAALTGVGVHFSGPFISDAERHGSSQVDFPNNYIDNACKDALVDIMASYLLHRHGGRAMELYLADPNISQDEPLKDLVERTLDRRALPLADRIRASSRPKRLVLGPRKTSDGNLRRVVLPMFTWDHQQISDLLSDICPRGEDQIDRAVPSPILSYLGDNCHLHNDRFDGLVATFDEDDAIKRLQPQQEAECFPWKDESEWQMTLGNPSVVKTYLDIVYETTKESGLESESLVVENTYLPDESGMARPLAEMFSAVNLPPNLGQREYVPIVHPELQDHRLLKRREWKPRLFTLDDYLDNAQLETASPVERKSFWTWLHSNWRTVKRRQTLIRIATLPVWPSSNGEFLPLDDLCEPRKTRIGSIMGDAIKRPSHVLLSTGLVIRTGRGRLTFRSTPSIREFEGFLSERIHRFPRERQLSPAARQEFHKLERDLSALVSDTPQLKDYLGELAKDYSIGLDKDGNLKDPDELVRDEGALRRLHLLNRHILDRSSRILDRIDGWGPRAAPSTHQIVDALREDGARLDAHVPRIQEYLRQSQREDIEPSGLVDIPCIPVKGELRSPSQIALRGSRDFWGDWRIPAPVTDINPETQRLYRKVGVVGGTPTPTSSRQFFQWLASQDAGVIDKHIDQILRHINHESGPYVWSDEFPGIPFILVENDGGKVRLVTKLDATKSRSRVVVPDFEELEEAIGEHPGRRPVELAIVQSPRVMKPVTARLREFGVRTLSSYAGEPVEAVGTGQEKPARNFDFERILDSLQSGLKGRQLQKRLAKLDLDAPEGELRSNWRQRLSRIQDVRPADSVTAVYKLGRYRFRVPVDGELDKGTGTLWIRSDSDLRTVFFDVIAGQIFEWPKKYYGSILDLAYKMDMRERYPLEYVDDEPLQEDTEIDETDTPDKEDRGPSATPGSHSVPKKSPRNLPNPGQIPAGDGVNPSVKKGSRGVRRPHSATESAQINDLKENQYAWHCQACIAETEPEKLAPLSSYVEVYENRRLVMQAHHCDHYSAGGARHAGNILLLCGYHHGDLGDAVSRTEVTRALGQAVSRIRTFNSGNGVSKSLQGKVVTIQPPQRQTPVSFFFTEEHADYWLTKANEEGLT